LTIPKVLAEESVDETFELMYPLLNGAIRRVPIENEGWELKPLEQRLEMIQKRTSL